jgi:polyketide biosynthesis enoyl-CoA hydratase PksH
VSYETIEVRFQGPICHVQFDRPQDNNTINERMIAECHQVLSVCDREAAIVVLSGTPEVFCLGADFNTLSNAATAGECGEGGSELLYDLWLKLATGPYVTLSHVRGRANAGGLGFIAASDIVLADLTARFSLSEMLFGIFPACVLPFLIRRAGYQRAHYLTLMTQPIDVRQAHAWGLVDAYDAQSEFLLRRHLSRLQHLSKTAIRRYKQYANGLCTLIGARPLALAGSAEMLSDPDSVDAISRYAEKGLLPWQT